MAKILLLTETTVEMEFPDTGQCPLTMSWGLFIDAHSQTMPIREIMLIADTLGQGDTYYGGGGAAPGFTLSIAGGS